MFKLECWRCIKISDNYNVSFFFVLFYLFVVIETWLCFKIFHVYILWLDLKIVVIAMSLDSIICYRFIFLQMIILYNVFETIILSIIFFVLKIKLFYFLGRMGINFHHPGTDNIMALNSKSSYEIFYKISSQVYSISFSLF